jgi:hypothetical protein
MRSHDHIMIRAQYFFDQHRGGSSDKRLRLHLYIRHLSCDSRELLTTIPHEALFNPWR